MRFLRPWAAVLSIFVAYQASAADTVGVDDLAKALTASDPAVKIKAADDLSQLGPHAKTAVPALSTALKDTNADLQWRAARALGAIGPAAADAVPVLTEALKSADPTVKAYAAYALGQIGSASKGSAEQIAVLLTDSNKDVRRSAIAALTEIKPDPAVIVPIMRRALEDPDVDPSITAPALAILCDSGDTGVRTLIDALQNDKARYWATVGLGKCGPRSKDAVPQLTKLAADNEPEIRMAAVIALGEIGPDAKAGVPALVKALDDPQNSVRYGAAFALGRIGAPEAADELKKQINSDDHFLKMVSAWALAKINPNDNAANEQAVKLLVVSLKDPDRRVRAAAARGLQELKAPRGQVAEELAKLMSDADPMVRANVADALAGLGESALPALSKGLDNDDLQSLSVAVIQKLGHRAEGAVPQLIKELDDKDPDYRREVLFALAAIGPDAKDAVPSLINALDDPEPRVRYTACYALGKIGPASADAAAALQKNFTADDWMLKVASVWALLQIEPQDEKLRAMAVPLLAAALEKTDRDLVKVEIADALGKIGPPAAAATAALQKTLDESDSQEVREAAAAALKKIQQR